MRETGAWDSSAGDVLAKQSTKAVMSCACAHVLAERRSRKGCNVASCKSVRNMSKGSPFKHSYMCSLLQASSVADSNLVIKSQATPVNICNPCRSSADQWQVRKHPEPSEMSSGVCGNSKYAVHICEKCTKKCFKTSNHIVM